MRSCFVRSFFIMFALLAVLVAAENIVPVESGYYYSDSLYSAIYYSDGNECSKIISGPGAGRFFSVSADGKMIGFKYREQPGGKEAPAIYHVNDQRIELLHDPVFCAGQVSFSSQGDVAYTIGNMLYIISGDKTRQFDLGAYSNLAPISPDGASVAFNDNDDRIWVMDLVKGVKTLISENGKACVIPEWSSDSRYLSYRCLDGTIKIYDKDHGKVSDLGQAASPKWSPANGKLAYFEVTPNEDLSDISTETMIFHAESGTKEAIKINNIDPQALFFTYDGTPGFLDRENTLAYLSNASLKKQRTEQTLQVSPQTYTIAVPAVDSYLDVPYIHQVYDTPGQRGYSSCAPTTAAMVLAYYNLIPKWPFVSGFNNLNDYGAYVHERYYYNDYYFEQSYNDCNSSGSYCYKCYGGMGYMWTGGSPKSRMAGYYNKHGVSTNQTWSTPWSTVANEIDKEQPFSICNFLSSSGHLIVAKGRTDNDQRTVIVNDPYGDRNLYSWPNYYGKTVKYDWPGYNHGHVSLNYANTGYTSMPWCIATDYTAPAVIDSIVDDKQFNNGFYIKAQGNTVPMRYYHSTKSGYGGHHWWTFTETGKSDVCYVKWTPRVENSYYEIKAYIPAHGSASTAVYKIHHAAGVKDVIVDQSAYNDTLVSLGKYLMSNDGSNYVYLGDSTAVSGEILAFDAMVWTPVELTELDFVSDYSDGYPGYPVNFNRVSTLPEGDYNYSWDFGDGTFGTGDSVAHAYADTGTFTITMTTEANGVILTNIRFDMITIAENTFTGAEVITISPDSMETITNKRPTFLWEDQDQPAFLSVSETPDFHSLYFVDSTMSNMCTIDKDLGENKTYYWKVACSSGSSKVYAFKVNAENSLPLPFDLNYPENGFVSDTTRPYFEWSLSRDKDPDDEVEYKLFIGAREDSMKCIYKGPETVFQTNEDLSENASYVWYVEAVDKYKASIRSSEKSRTIAVNTVNEAPSVPVLISPNYNSYQTTRYPYFEWSAAQDPDPGDQVRYKVFYWKATSTSPLVINTEGTSYSTRKLSDMREYFWTVAAIDNDDVYTYSDTSVFYTNTQLDVVDIPDEYRLGYNHPNPFNPVTTLSYDLPEDTYVELTIYDLSGKRIATLVNDFQACGKYELNFNASGFPSGIYVYRIDAGNFHESRKMLLLK